MRDNIVVHKIINSIRVKKGLKPLKFSPSLYLEAKRHTKMMAKNGCLFHSGGTDMTGEHDLGSENVLQGPRNMTPRQMVNLWMRSSGHRRWLLEPDLKYAATSIIRTKKAAYATWWFGYEPVSKTKQLLKTSAIVLSPLLIFALIKLIFID